MPNGRRGRHYPAAALLLLNTVVVFVTVNVLVLFVLRFLENRFSNDPVSVMYGLERLERVYPGLDKHAIRESWHERIGKGLSSTNASHIAGGWF